MGLRDIKIPEATIQTPGGEFAVRGLSLDDISWLVERHESLVNQIFDTLGQADTGADGEVATQDLKQMAGPLLTQMPDVCSALIAAAADEPTQDGVTQAGRLPFACQVDALENVLVLTLEASGGVKKLAETVIRMMQGVTSLGNG